MKKILFISSCVFIFSFLQAQIPATDSECRVVAVNYAQNYMEQRNLTASNIVAVFGYQENLKVLMKEVRFDNGLSIVLSAYKSCKPVLLYSTSDEALLPELANLPDVLRCFIDNYCSAIQFAVDSLALNSINAEWNFLLNLASQENQSHTNRLYGPLITTKWGQTSSNDNSYDRICDAYNYYVEVNSNSCTACSTKKCPTGCIATAMAQIMNYWKYPVYLPESIEQFDWCNMPDELFAKVNGTDNANYETERNAIAKLMAACGVAANMDYCCKNTWYLNETCQSFAFPIDARNALVNSFGYNPDANVKRRLYYSNAQWKRMLVENIEYGRPVLYAGVSFKNDNEYYKNGGHAFVCDGYNADTEKFHFNWGHKGDYSNTWCTLDSIIESNGSGLFNWNHFERAVFDIYPSNSQDYCAFTLPLQDYYSYYYTFLGNTTPAPYLNVPNTATNLISVPDNSQYPTSWRTIPSGATTEYMAHEEILLVDGFRAEAGCDFHAYIVPCESCEGTRGSHNPSSKQVSDKFSLPDGKSFLPTLERFICSSLSIFPNPVSSVFNIRLNNPSEKVASIEVFDVMGGRVLKYDNAQNNIDASNLPKGMYMVRMTSSLGNVFYGRFLKE